MDVRTIDDVLDALDGIARQARRDGSRRGYFTVLYRDVTRRVRDGIADGRFDDGARMEALDVRFARRYLDTVGAYGAGREMPGCWRLALDACNRRELTILQHLMLGMNAHINLDLSIAAAETAPGPGIQALERDFGEINAILVEAIDEVQDLLGACSPWLAAVDWAAGRRDEGVARFGLRGTRKGAWLGACHYARLDDVQRVAMARRMDRVAQALGRRIMKPGRLLGGAMRLVRMAERRSIDDVYGTLEGLGRPAAQARA